MNNVIQCSIEMTSEEYSAMCKTVRTVKFPDFEELLKMFSELDLENKDSDYLPKLQLKAKINSYILDACEMGYNKGFEAGVSRNH